MSVLPSGAFSYLKVVDDLQVVGGNSYFSGAIFANSISVTSGIEVDGALELESLIVRDSGSNNTITIDPPTLTANYTLTLPVDDGTPGQVLSTDGSGVLSWVAGGGGSPGGANTQVQFNDGGVFGGDADFTFDKATTTLAVGASNANSIVTIGTPFSIEANTISGDTSLTTSAGNTRITTTSGNTVVSSTGGGNVVLRAGTTTVTGNVDIQTIARTDGGNGGNVFIAAGGSGGGGNGGNFFIRSGISTSGTAGGKVELRAGNANAGGAIAGRVDIFAGNAPTGTDGYVSIRSELGVSIMDTVSIPNFQGGELVVFIQNAATVPTTNPVNGGILYVTGGALTYRGSSGTVTTIAPA